MKKVKLLLAVLVLGIATSSFISYKSMSRESTINTKIENVNVYVVNNTDRRIIVGVHKPNNCKSTSLSHGVDAGKKSRYTAEKGSCIKVYRGDILGSAEYENQTFTVND